MMLGGGRAMLLLTAGCFPAAGNSSIIVPLYCRHSFILFIPSLPEGSDELYERQRLLLGCRTGEA